MREKHRSIFEQFSSTFPPQTVQKWENMISEWKIDKSKPNPYKEPPSCTHCYSPFSLLAYNVCCSATTLQDVRLELAKDDAASSAQGVISPHNITLTTFLTTGLDLEEQQYVPYRHKPCST